MAYTPQSWRKLYSLVDKQMDSAHRLSWCEKSRRRMHERLIELGSENEPHRSNAERERTDIENALRKLWRLEQKASRTQP
jgi:hypothetical protein